jgi:hypothetical protein
MVSVCPRSRSDDSWLSFIDIIVCHITMSVKVIVAQMRSSLAERVEFEPTKRLAMLHGFQDC